LSQRIPHHALTFGAHAVKLASRHGLKMGIAKAAARINPVLMVIEAGVSVLGAIDSWLTLKAARAHRDGLRSTIGKEEAKLELDRRKEELMLARANLDQELALRQRIGKINLLCAQACQEIFREMRVIRQSEIPDIDQFERLNDELEAAVTRMRGALDYYNRTTE
jgi:hypothetical protein